MSLPKLFHRTLTVALLTGISAGCSAGQTNEPVLLDDNSIREVITRVARHQIVPLADGDYPSVTSLDGAQSAKSPVGLQWTNPWGFVFHGLLRASDATGDKEVEGFVLKHNQIAARYWTWLKSLNTTLTNTAGLGQFQNSTSLGELMQFDKEGVLSYCGTMGTEIMEGILRHSGGKPTPEQKQLVEAIANYINTGQPRLPDGTCWRPTWRNSIVTDDLYKSCAFLTRWSEFTGDPKYLDDAANQIINSAKLLQDKDGLWYHGYFCNEHRNNGAKWGRANGWAMVAIVETLSAMPTNHPARSNLLNILQLQIEAVKKVQAPSGMWRQLLDHPELWEETSGTAMMAYGIARAANRGWIDSTNMTVARKAFAAVCRHVKPDGSVTDICEASGIFWGYDYYVARVRPEDEPHGRGPVMLAGAEILLASKRDTLPTNSPSAAR